MAVVPISSTPAVAPATTGVSGLAPAKSDVNFGELVKGLVSETNAQHLQADVALQQLVSGATDNVQGVVLSAVQADLSFRLALEIRNRLIESYQELMRMQF